MSHAVQTITIGDGTATEYDETHLIGVEVRVRDPSTGRDVELFMDGMDVLIRVPVTGYEATMRQQARDLPGYHHNESRVQPEMSLTLHSTYGDANANTRLPMT